MRHAWLSATADLCRPETVINQPAVAGLVGRNWLRVARRWVCVELTERSLTDCHVSDVERVSCCSDRLLNELLYRVNKRKLFVHIVGLCGQNWNWTLCYSRYEGRQRFLEWEWATMTLSVTVEVKIEYLKIHIFCTLFTDKIFKPFLKRSRCIFFLWAKIHFKSCVQLWCVCVALNRVKSLLDRAVGQANSSAMYFERLMDIQRLILDINNYTEHSTIHATHATRSNQLNRQTLRTVLVCSVYHDSFPHTVEM